MTTESTMSNAAQTNETRTPHADIHDPLEIRIRRIIRELVESNPFGVNAMTTARELQKAYFIKSLSNLGHPEEIYKDTQELLKTIASLTNSRIVEGMEILDKLPIEKPVFVVLNHFGINKLTTLPPKEVGLEQNEVETTSGKSVEEIYPFPMYYAAMQPVAEKLGVDLSEAHLKLPGQKLTVLQEIAGLIVIPEEKGQFDIIKQRTFDVINVRQNVAMVIFPEGETSGKRIEAGPFDTVPFHSGVWGIATELIKEGLSVPVLTAYQYWNPKSGFEIGIVNIDILKSDTTREEQDSLAENSRKKMQQALDLRMGKS